MVKFLFIILCCGLSFSVVSWQSAVLGVPAIVKSESDCMFLKHDLQEKIRKGQFAGALTTINEIERRCPVNAHLLADKMRVYIALERPVEAHGAGLRTGRMSSDGSITPDELSAVKSQLNDIENDLKSRFCRVLIVLTPADAKLTADGKPVPEFSGSGHHLWLTTGQHLLRVEHRNYEALERPVTALAGETVVLTLTSQPLLALLSVIGTPTGAEVRLGNMVLGLLPLKPTSVVTGVHQLKVAKEGYDPTEQPIELSAGEPKIVKVGLKLRPGVAPPDGGTLVVPPGPQTDLHPWGWVTAGIGGAIVVAAGVLNYLGIEDAQKANSLRKPIGVGPNHDDQRADYEMYRTRALREAHAGYALYAIGGGAVVAGFFMELLNPARQRKSAKPAAGFVPEPSALEFWQPPGLVGAGLSGQF